MLFRTRHFGHQKMSVVFPCIKMKKFVLYFTIYFTQNIGGSFWMTPCNTMFSLQFSAVKTSTVFCQKLLPETVSNKYETMVKPCASVSGKILKACVIISHSGKCHTIKEQI